MELSFTVIIMKIKGVCGKKPKLVYLPTYISVHMYTCLRVMDIQIRTPLTAKPFNVIKQKKSK